MDDAKSVHPRLGVEDAGASRKDPDVGDREGMRGTGVIKDGEGGAANGGGTSRTVGSVNSMGGRRIGDRSKVGDVRDYEVCCLRVDKGNGIESGRSNIGSSKRGRGRGRRTVGAHHEGAAGESGEEVIDFVEVKDRSSIRRAK